MRAKDMKRIRIVSTGEPCEARVYDENGVAMDSVVSVNCGLDAHGAWAELRFYNPALDIVAEELGSEQPVAVSFTVEPGDTEAGAMKKARQALKDAVRTDRRRKTWLERV